MTRPHTHTSTGSRELVSAVAGLACILGLSGCSFITEADLRSWMSGNGRDSWDSGGWYGGGGGGGDGGGGSSQSVGSFYGTGGIFIAELGCDIVWDLSGPATNGMDLMWDVEGVNYGAGSCDFGTDLYGTLEVTWYSVYFAGDYWGAAFYGGGDLYWYTYGYVYGGSGYTYAYSGYGSY